LLDNMLKNIRFLPPVEMTNLLNSTFYETIKYALFLYVAQGFVSRFGRAEALRYLKIDAEIV